MLIPGVYIRDVLKSPPGTHVVVHGWVKTRRDSKGIHFIHVNDGSSFADLQLIDEGAIAADVLHQVATGACVRATGTLVASPAAGQAVELKVTGLDVLGGADP
ncbi:MAG TPA: OB-fold nucleic acid binding domain-containing protein, partial [Polyangiaceae bacterium]|nr:OB-fold nucleic acid binding domain-containing protein [Polyangiaceae bacterium]